MFTKQFTNINYLEINIFIYASFGCFTQNQLYRAYEFSGTKCVLQTQDRL